MPRHLVRNLLIIFLISITLIQKPVSSAKILAVEFFGSKSHVITYVGLLDELARRGHEVTLLSPTKGLPSEKSIKEIFTIDADRIFKGDQTIFERKEANVVSNPFKFLAHQQPIGCREIYNLERVKALMTQKFDLVLLQPLFNDCALGLIHRLNTSLVLFSPCGAPEFLVSRIGGFHPYSFVSNMFLGFTDEMTFMQRMQNFWFSMVMEGTLKYYYEPIMEATYREMLGDDIPSARTILGNASLILSNGHFSVNGPKPNLPNVIDVGGMHSRPAKPLPKDLEDFVSKSGSDGFIIFSMGSMIKGDTMSIKKKKMFLDAFSKLKQQVIWKYESDDMSDLPKNVKLVKWLPQQDLLGHKNIKLFITHCGGGGTEEAIYHGVPLLGLPILGDQPVNAKKGSSLGYLLTLDWNTLTAEIVSNGIEEVLGNPKYRDNVKRLSKLFRDQPDDPLKRAVYWMEFVIRHKGAPHLKSGSQKLNTFQYHSLDVISAYLAIISGLIYIIFSLLRLIVGKVCGSGKSNINRKNGAVSNGSKKYN